MTRAARWSLWAAAVVAALLALYAAAGWWLAPRYVRDALVEQAAARGLELRIEDVRTNPFALAVDLEGLRLSGPGGASLARVQGIHADFTWASLWRDAWIAQRVEVREPRVELPFNALQEKTSSTGKPEDPVPLVVESLVLTGGAVHFEQGPREVTLQNIEVALSGLSTHTAEPAAYRASARLAAGGTLSSQGTASLQPLAAHGTVDADALALAKVWKLAAPQLEPWPGRVRGTMAYAYEEGELVLRDINALAELEGGGSLAASGSAELGAPGAALELRGDALPLSLLKQFLPDSVQVEATAGTFSSDGRFTLAEDIVYEGSLVIRGMRLEERDSGRLLLAWEHAETPRLRFQSSPGALELGEIAVRSPEGRLVIEEGGAINFGEAFAGGEGDEEGDGAPFRAAFERLRIANGILHFADRSLENDFAVTIVELSGAVTGFSTAQNEPAQVRLNGRVQPYGTARIRGTINLNAPTSLADITANLRNLRLQAFNPYVAKFAGYRIASGRVSAELRYELRNGRLVGDNELVFEEMQLGEKVESAGALDLPLDLVVALLADSKGRITLDIPVSGDLNDPKFDLGAIVAKAVGNVLRKIVTAPFRMLANLVGGGEKDRDLGEVRFAAGSASLSPPQEEGVARVAQALEQRPRLGVTVRGGYDPGRDLDALRMRTVRREVAERAGIGDIKGGLDFGDPKVVRAAERLYLQRVGSRQDLQKLRAADTPYGRALIQSLAAALPAEPGSAQTLARARAEAVRAALLEHGVDPSRVRLAGAAEKAADQQGVPTELALVVDQPRTESASISEVQRKLNAAGFEAGPVDGILGPKTRRALRNFQEAQGIEPTGEPDRPTLEALP